MSRRREKVQEVGKRNGSPSLFLLGRRKSTNYPAPLNPSRSERKEPQPRTGVFHSNSEAWPLLLGREPRLLLGETGLLSVAKKKKKKEKSRDFPPLVRSSPLQRVMSLPAKAQRKIQRGSDPVWLVSKIRLWRHLASGSGKADG